MRGVGDTFRKVLETMHHMSENDGSLVLFVSLQGNHVAYAMRLCSDMFMVSVPDFVTVNLTGWSVTLKNNSRVMFRRTTFVEEFRFQGLKLTKLVEDFGEETASRRYYDIRPELEKLVERYHVAT